MLDLYTFLVGRVGKQRGRSGLFLRLNIIRYQKARGRRMSKTIMDGLGLFCRPFFSESRVGRGKAQE